MFTYPTEFPLQAISTAREIIAGGKWLEQKARLAKCQAEIQCYAYLLIFGDPDVFGVASTTEQLLPNNDGIAALEQLIADCDNCPNCDCTTAATADTAASDAAIDPATITLILTLIAPLAKQLLEWIRNRRNPQPAPANSVAPAAGEIA